VLAVPAVGSLARRMSLRMYAQCARQNVSEPAWTNGLGTLFGHTLPSESFRLLVTNVLRRPIRASGRDPVLVISCTAGAVAATARQYVANPARLAVWTDGKAYGFSYG